LQQLLAEGPGALAAAAAIAAGGQSAVAQINALTAQIAAAGGDLGQQMAQQFYGAGVAAAQGMVDALQDKKKGLQKVAEGLAGALVDAIKKKLGIKSPSRVFRELGRQSVDGLALGLDEIYVRRQGAAVADALTTGFQSRPALSAYLGGTSSGSVSAVPAVHLTADTIDDLQRGRKVTVATDAYLSSGGTKRRPSS
jgi:hypothetical protein